MPKKSCCLKPVISCPYPRLVDIADIINRDYEAFLGRWDLEEQNPLAVGSVVFVEIGRRNTIVG
jgi:hypothetical protein